MRIRSALLALAAATAAPLLVLFVISAGYVYDLENQEVEESALARNRATLGAIDSEIRGGLNVLRAMTTSRALASDDINSFRGVAQAILATEPTWQNIVLLTPDGRQLINTRLGAVTALPQKPDDRKSFEIAVRNREPAVSDLSTAPLLGQEPGICVQLPIEREGQLVYVLAAVIRPVAFQAILASQPLPAHSVTGLVGTDGRIIARVPAVAIGSFASPDYLKATSGAREGWYHGNTIEGLDAYTSFVHSRLTGWSLGYAVPSRVLSSGARRTIELLLLGFFFSTGFALYISLGLTRRIAGPIGKLAAGAQSIGVSTSKANVTSTISEVAQLAQAIRSKDARIEESYTKLEDQAAELLEKNVNRSRFLALLSHELRNPLAPLRTGLATLKLISEGPRRTQIETMMERQITQMSRLINDLLDVGRIDRGQIELQPGTVDLTDSAYLAIESVRGLIDARVHRLHIDVPSDPIWVIGDAVRLEQVIGNLLTNAAKYTQPGGVITLTIEVKLDRAMLSVADTGIGFDAEDANRLFEMFTRLPNAQLEDSGGLGIGLSLARTLVELHHGSLTAASDGLGQGAKFVVSLPLYLEETSVRPEISASAPTSTGLRQILIVDDNHDAAEALADLLRIHSMEVNVAHDGLAAMHLLPDLSPSVVFIDLNMPGASGYEVAEFVRRCPWGQSIVLVAVTGMGQPDDFIATHRSGFDAHLVKPADLSQLIALATMDRPQAVNWMSRTGSQRHCG